MDSACEASIADERIQAVVEDSRLMALDPVASISKEDNSSIAVQYCNFAAPVAYVGLHGSLNSPLLVTRSEEFMFILPSK
jgi:hypothetical protein